MVTRKLGLPDSETAIRFTIGSTVLPFSCFRVGTSPIQTEMGSWPIGAYSEWISENSHQSTATGTACFVMYIVRIVVSTASLKEKENTTTLGTVTGQLSSRPITGDALLLRV